MCPLPMLPNISLKAYLYGALAVIVLGLVLYCHHLSGVNTKLGQDNAVLKSSFDGKVAALSQCSANTENLKNRETEITNNAKAAIAEAKKNAVEDYKASQSILFRKPTQPVVTPQNAVQYGGTDTSAQIKDYLATQYLMNDLIDSRGGND